MGVRVGGWGCGVGVGVCLTLFVHVSVREHVSVCVSECVSSIFSVQMLLEHVMHSCDKHIVTVGSNVLNAIEIHVRLHHFNT